MAQKAIVKLDILHCIGQDDHNRGSEPYIWPALIRIDDVTVATSSVIRLVAPPSVFARETIKNSMLGGEEAPIPAPVATLSTTLEDNVFDTRLILVVALWEEDDTPESAIRAGYEAFVDGLQATLGNLSTLINLKSADETLKQAQQANDPAAIEAAQKAKDDLIKGIKDQISSRVRSAIKGEISFLQELGTLLHVVNQDDLVDSNFWQFPQAIPQSFTLHFVNSAIERYDIRGQITLKEEEPHDPCQLHVNKVRAAETAVRNVLRRIEQLQLQLQHASPLQKPALIAEIQRVRRVELTKANKALDSAESRLAACRGMVPETLPTEAHP